MKLEISKLMDHYTDMEFAPAAGNLVNTDAIRDRVLLRTASACQKKRLGFKLLLIAAAIAACTGLLAAGRGVVRYVSPVTGAALVAGDNYADGQAGEAEVVVLEDGRLWFVAGGQRVDITDLVDETTAYTYVISDPDAGTISRIIAGGTPEDFGWCEIFEGPGTGSMGSGENFIVPYANVDGEWINYNELHISEEEEVEFSQSHEMTYIRQGWYEDGLVRLGLSDPCGPVE